MAKDKSGNHENDSGAGLMGGRRDICQADRQTGKGDTAGRRRDCI